MRSFRFFLATILLFFLFQNAWATSRQGGYITYEHIANDSFEVTLVLYSECTVPAPLFGPSFTIQVNSSCTTGFPATLLKQNGPGGTTMSLLCDSLGNGCSGGSGPSLINKHIYQGIVVLSTPCADWTFSFNTCCTPVSPSFLNNGFPGNGDVELSATVNTLIDPSNSGPQINTLGNQLLCVGTTLPYAAGATDPDGDSLFYSFHLPTIASPNVVYSLPTGLTIDSLTGNVTFSGNTLGRYYIYIRMEQRNLQGQVLGYITHMIFVNVIQCTGANALQVPPSLPSALQNPGGSAVVTSPTSLQMCANGNACFDIVFQDSNSWQTLTTDLASLQAALPGASISSTGTNPVTVSVCWSPPAGVTGSRSFSVSVADSACPVSGFASRSYQIDVLSSVKAIEDSLSICQGDTAQLAVIALDSLVWSSLAGDPITPATFSCDSCFSPRVSPSQSTTYQVQTTTAGICPGTDTIHVEVVPLPSFAVDRTADSLCPGDSVAFVYTGTGTGYTLSASSPLPTRIDGDSVWVNSTFTGTYTVQIEAAIGACASSGQVDILTSPGIGVLSVQANDLTLCQQESVTLTAFASSVNPQLLYDWQPVSGNGAVLTDSPSATTTYTVTAFDTVGGCSEVATQTVAVSTPMVLTTSADTQVCQNESFDLFTQVSGGVAPYAYTWSTGSPQGNQTTLSVNGPATVTVIVTDSFGCVSDTGMIAVSVPPPFSVTLPADTVLTEGDVVTLCFTPSGGLPPYTASWNNGQTDSCITLTATQDTLWYVTVTDGCGNMSNDFTAWRVLSGPNSVDDGTGNSPGMQWYPNPASDVLHWQWSGRSGSLPEVLRLHDVQGRLVRESVLQTSSGTIQLRDLPAGWYILSYEQDGAWQRHPLMKQ